MAGQHGSSYTRLELAEKEHSVLKCGGLWAIIAVAQHSQEDYAMRQRRERMVDYDGQKYTNGGNIVISMSLITAHSH